MTLDKLIKRIGRKEYNLSKANGFKYALVQEDGTLFARFHTMIAAEKVRRTSKLTDGLTPPSGLFIVKL